MTSGGQWLDELDVYGNNSPFTRYEADQIWRGVSQLITQQSNRQVRALLGSVRPNSVFQTVEMPELISNPNVLGIEQIYLRPSFDFGGQ